MSLKLEIISVLEAGSNGGFVRYVFLNLPNDVSTGI